MRKGLSLLFALLLTLPCTAFSQEVEEGLMVARAQFTTGITDREPADTPEMFETGVQTAHFFTEILAGEGSTISHRWYYNDVQIADVTLKIGSDRWRTWSTKQIWHLTPGTLKVEVVTPGDQVLMEKEILIQ